MTDILVLSNTEKITTETIKNSLDGKSLQFMTDEAIDSVSKDVVAYVKSRTNIENYDNNQVIAAVNAMIKWQVYMVYIESISEYIADQSERIPDERSGKFRQIAEIYLSIIDVTLEATSKMNRKSVAVGISDTYDD